MFSDPRHRTMYLLDFEEFWKRKMYVQDFGLVTRLAGTNLFRRENSYGVAREGKLHCKEEGKLRIVCQVEGKLQIVVTSEGKFTQVVKRRKNSQLCCGGKTSNCLSSGGKTPNGLVKWRENSKIFERRENSSCFVEELRKTWTSNDTRLAGNCKLIRKRKLIWCGKGRENSIVTRRENS